MAVFSNDIRLALPNDLNLYHVKSKLSGKICQLGPHQSQPVLTTTFGANWSLRSSITISMGDQTLATVSPKSTLSSSYVMTLPQTGATYPLAYSDTYSFTAPVRGVHRLAAQEDRFEWRSTAGAEADALESGASGWKLVRVREPSHAAAPAPGSKRASGVSSDSHEIVAVWVEYGGWSDKKLARFKFLGSGASGELGQEWSVLALASFLRIYLSEVGFEDWVEEAANAVFGQVM